PGDDLDLAVGFLFTEGIVRDPADVVTAELCAGTEEPNSYNVVRVNLAAHVPEPAVDVSRSFYTTSSCGVCGKASLEAVRTRSRYQVADDPVQVSPEVLAVLPERLREAQKVFARTGGLHAAGLFTADGQLEAVREDVGRHNPVDKLTGRAVRPERLPPRPGGTAGAAAAAATGAGGLRAGQLRIGPEGVDGRDTGAGGGVGPEHARGGPGGGGGDDPARVPARVHDERLHRHSPAHPAGVCVCASGVSGRVTPAFGRFTPPSWGRHRAWPARPGCPSRPVSMAVGRAGAPRS